MEQVTCITFFKFDSFWKKVWAFGMMQFAHKHLAKAKGLSFYKLMGSGKGNGFNPLPDWSIYSLLTIWDSLEEAEEYITSSKLYEEYSNRNSTQWTLFMINIKAHGSWSGKQPFQKSEQSDSSDDRVCVITRASIKKRFLFKFWRYVPTSSHGLENNPNLLYTKGIGEVPITQMATFSIWKNIESLKSFAYQGKQHNKAIKMTRELGWYSEELFARFKIIKEVGTSFI